MSYKLVSECEFDHKCLQQDIRDRSQMLKEVKKGEGGGRQYLTFADKEGVS